MEKPIQDKYINKGQGCTRNDNFLIVTVLVHNIQ
jgi:hypothetical protein